MGDRRPYRYLAFAYGLFAGGMTAYVLVGVKLEERDLVAAFGDRYRRYHEEVPGFLPRPWRSVSTSPTETDGE